jgi:tripartite-type tricarboxylate transporter receptor subunit TctC
MMIRLAVLLLGALVLAGAPQAAHAQDYPNRVVRLIIPFPPGGSSDATARVLADALGKLWQQRVIVENKPGAGTTVGAAFVASSDPDGYTIYLNSVSHAIVPSLYDNLRYDPLKSFEPVSRIAQSPILLVVHPSSGIKTLEELLAAARAKPGQLNYGSPGVGASPHLAAEMMIAAAKIKVQHVPFNGAGPLSNAMLGKVVDFGFTDIAALPLVKEGTLKALAVTSLERLPDIPDVPTLNETVQKGFEVLNWNSILAPAGTPREIVEFLNRSLVRILETPEVKRILAAQGFQAVPSTPAELGELIASDIKKFKAVVDEAGIKRN